MANINLSTGEVKPGVDLNVSRGGMTSLIFILIVILALYGVEIFWGKKMATETEAINAQFNSNYSNLTTGNPIEVIDFQNRITVAKKLSAEGRDIRESLLDIEKTIIPGVYLSSYEYDQKTGMVILTCIGDNYNLAAKQILNFKKSTYFSDTSGGETELVAETGKVKFVINLKLK